MTVTGDLDTGIVLMAVYGSWSRQLARDSFVAFKKCLGQHPAALIIDLLALTDRHAASVNTWTTARHVATAMDPPVQAMICLPADSALADRLRRFGGSRLLPMFASVAQARTAAISRLPLTDQLRAVLAPDPHAPALARDLVTDACAAWHLRALSHPARMVVSELTANAAQHARTAITVLVSRHTTGLHLAVGDGDPRLPRLLPPRPPPADPAAPPRALYQERGQGLRVVDAVATRWGGLPTVNGKIVWATLYPRT